MMDEPFNVEQVEGVEPPARARVEPEASIKDSPEPVAETFARKRDYLTGFLAEEKPAPLVGGAGGALQESVIDALKTIYDPEIPVDIYELGLIYNVAASEDGDVVVTMTLTTPHCPVAESMPGEVEMRVLSVPGVRDAEVKLVWEPAWDPSKMSDEARLELGML
jgi:FeS assembly SUF system protein